MKKRLGRLYAACSVLALGALVTPVDGRIAVVMPLFAVLAVLAAVFFDRFPIRPLPGRGRLLAEAVPLVWFAVEFTQLWSTRHAVHALCETLGLPVGGMLLAAAIVLASLALGTLDAALGAAVRFLSARLGSRWNGAALRALCLLVSALLQYWMLALSCSVGARALFGKPLIALGNLAVLLAADTLLALLLGRWRPAIGVFSVITAMWSVANYYTILFHGSPLYFSELVNAPTAAAVALEYRYPLSTELVLIALLLTEQFIFLRQTGPLLAGGGTRRRTLLPRAALLAAALLIGGGTGAYVHANAFPWDSWAGKDGKIARFGYVMMTVDDMLSKQNMLLTPAGYDPDALSAPEAEPGTGERRPDLILILNESLCDLSLYTELDADRDCFAAFDEIEGLIRGCAVSPDVGGGTNNSEFELLTSKSMFLVNGTSPFTFMWDYQLERSVVSYLASLGYVSAGMHCEQAENYSRNVAYPLLGFDEVRLGYDAFPHQEYNGARLWTDAGNYKDMLACWDGLDADSPRLVYLLSFQNHGGYERCDDALDTVHVGRDFGEMTDDLNEYLSSLRLSAEAFRDLTAQLRDSGRDVIVCMVGDHAPSFIGSLPPKGDWDERELSIRQRTVPYFIWANFPLNGQDGTAEVSMVDLVPMTLRLAGLPLSPFYRAVLELHEALPLRTSNGLYRDAAGAVGVFDGNSPYYEQLNAYFRLEYNSLQKEPEYRAELFAPGSQRLGDYSYP